MSDTEHLKTKVLQLRKKLNNTRKSVALHKKLQHKYRRQRDHHRESLKMLWLNFAEFSLVDGDRDSTGIEKIARDREQWMLNGISKLTNDAKILASVKWLKQQWEKLEEMRK